MSFVLVIGHAPQLESEGGVVAQLEKLGADVRTLDLWEDFGKVVDEDGAAVRAIVIEAGDRPDLAMTALRAARRETLLESTPAIIALPAHQVTRVEPSSGFDDFIVVPYVAAELYARIRRLEWNKSEFLTDERLKMGAIVIDRAAHEVVSDGRTIVLTAKEFALLVFLSTNRGRVFSRESLLTRVWGARYEGGVRTVDIHVRRLRAKLGEALPLETMRGTGYKLRAPADNVAEAEGVTKAVERLDARPRAKLRVGSFDMPVPRIALSIGCPAGVGPEVSVLAAVEAAARVVLVGDLGVVLRAAELRGVARSLFVPVDAPRLQALPRGRVAVFQPTPTLASCYARPGAPTPRGGAAQLAWIDAACDLASSEEVDAMVTGPVSKEAIARSGARGAASFRGHTEHLQARLRAREVVMAFWTKHLTTSLATTHLPLASVPRALTRQVVGRAVYWLVDMLARLARHRGTPRVAVAALNPHAGEGGLLGTDEDRAILPGMVLARARLDRAGIRAELAGPVPAESAFRLAVAGRFDGVVAMYHDQATIPMKLVGFGEAVNVSLGLPIVRTSVDHGTAYDIAGKGIADARAMGEAIALAARLSGATGRTRATRGRSRKRRSR